MHAGLNVFITIILWWEARYGTQLATPIFQALTNSFLRYVMVRRPGVGTNFAWEVIKQQLDFRDDRVQLEAVNRKCDQGRYGNFGG